MKKYIDTENFKVMGAEIKDHTIDARSFVKGLEWAQMQIDSAPAADVALVVHAHWVGYHC